ncbi:MAG TPA: hypothetical protein VKR82_14470 [Candidatus Acidoferrales bacterium]|nr:hypothetical protein [Candidatus Acidoferrales bacterium]
MTAVKLEDARGVISAAEKKARETGQPGNIAVTSPRIRTKEMI